MSGRVFQDPLKGTAPNLTVAENLSLALDRERSPFAFRWALTSARRDELRERGALTAPWDWRTGSMPRWARSRAGSARRLRC